MIDERVKKCVRCAELVKSRRQAVPGYGDHAAEIFIIGEAPGRLGADYTGVPFTRDKSGVLLQKMLGKIGLSASGPSSERPELHGVYVTNIVKCNPRKNGTNRPPTKKEIENCSGYLWTELEQVRPRLVVPLGVPAATFVLGKKFEFGRLVKKDKYDVLPLWHPAFVIRGGGRQKMNEKKYYRYFAKICAYAEKSPDKSL